MSKQSDLMKNVRIEGAEDFAQWLTNEYDLPLQGMVKNLRKWKEQLK